MIPRKFAIVAIVLLVILTVLSIVLFVWKDNKKVTFTISYPDATATISQKGSGKPIATVDNNSSQWLKKQTYILTFNNDMFSKAPVEIEVSDKTNIIALDPAVSNAKLKELLTSEKTAIDTAVKSKSKNAFSYTEVKRELYHHGEWCTISFSVPVPSSNDPNIGNPDSVDIYSMVLQKKNGNWSVVAGPSLIITKPDNPGIPSYVIDAIDPSRVFIE